MVTIASSLYSNWFQDVGLLSSYLYNKLDLHRIDVVSIEQRREFPCSHFLLVDNKQILLKYSTWNVDVNMH